MNAFVCVMIAGLMPIMWAGCAKAFAGFRMKDNANPRDFLAASSGKAQRANWAQQNSWEAFAPFAAAVIIAHLSQVNPTQLNLFATGFIIARLLYGIFYILDKASLRSLVWMSGLLLNLAIYALAFSA